MDDPGSVSVSVEGVSSSSKKASDLLKLVEDCVDPFPVTADDLDPSKQFSFNYVASTIRSHLNTRAIYGVTDDKIRELTEKIQGDFWLWCVGQNDGNPHHANFQDIMLDKLLNVRPKWPSDEPDDWDTNRPGYYLAKPKEDD